MTAPHPRTGRNSDAKHELHGVHLDSLDHATRVRSGGHVANS